VYEQYFILLIKSFSTIYNMTYSVKFWFTTSAKLAAILKFGGYFKNIWHVMYIFFFYALRAFKRYTTWIFHSTFFFKWSAILAAILKIFGGLFSKTIQFWRMLRRTSIPNFIQIGHFLRQLSLDKQTYKHTNSEITFLCK